MFTYLGNYTPQKVPWTDKDLYIYGPGPIHVFTAILTPAENFKYPCEDIFHICIKDVWKMG
jgi:hypothetical protein